jgi:hypothetical protein
MFYIGRKAVLPAALGATVVLGAGVAYGEETSMGHGVTTATTSQDLQLTVTQTRIAGGPLSPGGPAQTVSFTVTNPTGGTRNVTGVMVTVASADDSPWDSVIGCSAVDFDVDLPTFTYGDMAAGTSRDGHVDIRMLNTNRNQDACQNQDVPLWFSIGPQ